MANLDNNYTGITKLRDWWSKVKANFVNINDQLVNHIAGTADKHAAQHLTYSGNFTSKENVKDALDQAKKEIDTIVVNASKDPEVALARSSSVKEKDFDTLDARLEESEQDHKSHVAEYTTYEGKRLYILNPYKNGGSLSLKGQLHCHSTGSDGAHTPAELVTMYRDAGYDFATITDHDIITPDPGVTGITWIGNSVEETVRRHIVAYDVATQSTSRVLQDIIDWHRNNGKLNSLAHPIWGGHFDLDEQEVQLLNGYNFIEVFNAGVGCYAEKQWDYALSASKKVFGVGVDDFHNSTSNPFAKGYVVVCCNENTKAAILESLRQGNFYASNGNDITVSLSGNVITATSSAASNIKFIGRDGLTLQENNGVTEASYTIKGDELYVRVVSIKIADSSYAWSQPIFVDVIGGNDRVYPEIIKSNIANMSRQSIINSNFDIWQRNISFINPAGYTADRWKTVLSADGGTYPGLTHTRELLTIADNLKRAFYFYRIATDGAGDSLGANSYYTLRQYIENGVRLLCGDGITFTLSFWARSSIAGKKIGTYMVQRYGTGGSPSAANTLVGKAWTLDSTWKKFTAKFSATTLIGKVFGANNDDYLDLVFIPQWGNSIRGFVNADTEETFVGAGTIDIAQVQLCVGDKDLPYAPKSFAEELRDCMRYYEKSMEYDIVPANGITRHNQYPAIAYTTTNAKSQIPFMVPKRKIPTISFYRTADGITDGMAAYYDTSWASATGTGAELTSKNGFVINMVATLIKGSSYLMSIGWAADAEL